MSKLVLPLLLIVFTISFFNLSAQNIAVDTLNIEEVNIVKSRKNYLTEGHQVEKLSSRQLDQFLNRTLGEALQYSSAIQVRSYGSAGAGSSVSFRGLGSSQTQVNWNGFPINSVTLGSADVSNIPVIQGQSISMVPGASGVSYGSGTFGGAVNIDYDSSKKDSGYVSCSLLYGYMNTVNGNLSYSYKTEKLILSGALLGGKSDGDFEYYDEIINDDLKRKNANYSNIGLQQYFSYKNSNYSEIKGGIWVQAKDLNLPEIEGSFGNSYENQKDSTFRAFVQWKKVFKTSSLSVKSAWFCTDQHYIKKESPESDHNLIDSRIKSKTLFGDINYRQYILSNLSAEVGFTFSNARADVSAYQGMRKDKVIGLVGGLKFENNGYKVSYSMRKDWGSNVDSDILIDLGSSIKLVENKWYLKGAYSQKFRRPTFNDLFWIPGGNSELLPESGYSCEFGTVYILESDLLGGFEFDIAAYYSEIENMIIWRPPSDPAEGADWQAKNYKDVTTKGIDFRIKHNKELGEFTCKQFVALSYSEAINNHAIDETITEGGKLLYAPELVTSITSNLAYRSFNLDLNWQYTSERIYDDYGGALDPYWLINSNISKRQSFKNGHFVFSFSVDNILNHRYQSIRSYPMPGRVWQLSIKYLLNFNS